jgi:hypothetical protein
LSGWIENGVKRNPNHVGFIYKITNTLNGKFYIGQKQLFRRITKKPLKGRVNKRHSLKESDWREYYGSSEELLKDIQELGVNVFQREILRYCTSKWFLNYYELKYQLFFDVINPMSNSYNGILNVRLRKTSEKAWLFEKKNYVYEEE